MFGYNQLNVLNNWRLLILLVSCLHSCCVNASCSPDPCQNDAECLEAIHEPGYICKCPVGFHGQNCDENSFTECQESHYGEVGELFSPNFPEPYDSRDNCLYFIKVPSASHVVLNFSVFDVEDFKDSLEIGAGPLADYDLPDVVYLEGHEVPPPLEVESNQVFFIWNTDRNLVFQGWHIKYTSVEGPPVLLPITDHGESWANAQWRFSEFVPVEYFIVMYSGDVDNVEMSGTVSRMSDFELYVADLNPGQIYTFQVISVFMDEETESNIEMLDLRFAGPYLHPITNFDSTYAGLEWSYSGSASSFIVRYQAASDGSINEQTVDGSARSFMFENLTPGESYTFSVSSVSQTDGSKAHSNQVNFNSAVGSAEDSPFLQQITSSGSNGAQLQWDYDGNNADSFIISYRQEGSATEQTMTVAGSERSAIVNDLVVGENYEFRVAVVTGDGDEFASNYASYDSASGQSVSSPQAGEVTEFSSTSANVMWDYQGPTPDSFFIRYSSEDGGGDGGGGSQQVAVADGEARSTTIDGLTPGAAYSFSVSALVDGSEYTSSAVYLTTPLGCEVNPCTNGGACLTVGNAYSCNCAPGFSGQNCQSNVNDCSGISCMNGGECIDHIDGFDCACADGFTGTTCEVVVSSVNECGSNPCQNGAACFDGHNSYTCNCVDGFDGDHCELVCIALKLRLLI
ncbi:uncharacterized protein [Antedon mediterranea]|uniref:uncharacterized protein n=1 Tax=Antedon mediterranea TaxID=105859 RepID=UPI003AF8E459